jgi:glycosyltransferase involved in cell wall biosynthesis
MNICLVAWAPFFAGAEVALERLAIGLRDAGEEVTCVVGTDGELLARLKAAKLDVHFVPTHFTGWRTAWKYMRSRAKLQSLWSKQRPDVVHSNDLPTHQLVSDAARRLKIPRICHHRWFFDGGGLDWFNKYGAERHLFVSRALEDTLRGSSAKLAQSPGEVVYDGLPLPNRPDDAARAHAKQTLGLAPEKLSVLYAGQIIERKGVADLLHAWQALQPRWGERAELTIVGDDLEQKGAYRVKMEALAKELALAARFAGFQRNVPVWLAAADIVLVPSHAEPLGNAVLEAMAHARPVIGTNVGGLPEMIVGEGTGLLVPPHSPPELAAAIERLLHDQPLRQGLGTAARVRCEELFSIEAHVAAMQKQYRLVSASAM